MKVFENWEAIAELLSGGKRIITVDAVKKKWSNLHDSYRIKRAQTGRGNDNEETPTNWPFFQPMLFLEDIQTFSTSSERAINMHPEQAMNRENAFLALI
uniref:MADF domain-containing protein n=1 Tax=Acrobeloides nanus TaxID=290746 RepID=A0A914EDF8_9BILA